MIKNFKKCFETLGMFTVFRKKTKTNIQKSYPSILQVILKIKIINK